MVREASRFEAIPRGAIMAELVDDSVAHRCLRHTQCGIGGVNPFAFATPTIHRFCGKACGQAGGGRREGACSRASRWIARVLSSEPVARAAMQCAAVQAPVWRAIVVQ
jgi:hypothetical protein